MLDSGSNGWQDDPEFQSMDNLDGDFYREPDVVRGISLAQSLESYGAISDGCHVKGSSLKGVHRFSSTSFLPRPCLDKFVQLTETTLYMLADGNACHLLNGLLDFLERQVTASIVKVNHQKFTIKADVIIDSTSCTLKIRTHSLQCGKWAVEFQRRKGDSVCFLAAYQLASQYLTGQFTGVESNTGAKPERPLLPLEPKSGFSSVQDENPFEPLLQMAGLIDQPDLQAEAALALVDLVEAHAIDASSLYGSHGLEKIGQLLKSKDRFDILYPVTRLLQVLAQNPEAALLINANRTIQTFLAGRDDQLSPQLSKSWMYTC